MSTILCTTGTKTSNVSVIYGNDTKFGCNHIEIWIRQKVKRYDFYILEKYERKITSTFWFTVKLVVTKVQ